MAEIGRCSSVPDERVRPGETLAVRVVLRPYAGKELVEISRLCWFPALWLAGPSRSTSPRGRLVRRELSEPESLRGLMENLSVAYPSKSIVVSLSMPDSGVSLRGCLLPSLPDWAMDTLRSSNQTRRADAYHVADRTLHPCDRLVSGAAGSCRMVRPVGSQKLTPAPSPTSPRVAGCSDDDGPARA